MRAVWTGPEQPNPAPLDDVEWARAPHVLRQMHRLWVIRLVHRHRCRVVIERDVDRAPECRLDASAGAAATGEQIHDELVRVEKAREIWCLDAGAH
jgi:hypothetical protein